MSIAGEIGLVPCYGTALHSVVFLDGSREFGFPIGVPPVSLAWNEPCLVGALREASAACQLTGGPPIGKPKSIDPSNQRCSTVTLLPTENNLLLH